MIAIRKAEDADAATLSLVLTASIRELCSASHHDDPDIIKRWTANKTPEAVMHWMANPRTVLFLAERKGEIAGVGSISLDGEVLLNYVAPSHRFRGVSRALLDYTEAALIEQGVVKAKLMSTETAHRFYRDAGWIDVGEPTTIFGLTGYPMEKILSAT